MVSWLRRCGSFLYCLRILARSGAIRRCSAWTRREVVSWYWKMGAMISLMRMVSRTMAMPNGPIDSASGLPLRTPRIALSTAWIGRPITVHQINQVGCQRSPSVSHGSWRVDSTRPCHDYNVTAAFSPRHQWPDQFAQAPLGAISDHGVAQFPTDGQADS